MRKTFNITIRRTITVEVEDIDECIDNEIEDLIEGIKEDVGQFIHDCEFDIEEITIR